jgi:hypothetical protein
MIINNQEKKLEKQKNSNEIDKKYQELTKGSSSFFCFTQSSRIRKICYHILSNQHFEKVIVVMIASYTLMLIMETMSLSNWLKTTQNIIILITNIVFSVEMIMKTLLHGFFFNKNAVMKNILTFVDFLILFTFYSLLVLNEDFPLIKV